MGAKRDPWLERQISVANEPVAHAGTQYLFAGLLISLVTWPQSSWAYRPFDSTDAAVADKGVWEFEFSPLSYEHGDSGAAWTAPALRMNYGVAENWEVVLEGQADHFARGGSELTEAMLSAKTVLRQGSLQEKSGPSLASEFTILLPGIGTQDGAGLEWTGILSQRWDWGTIHLNVSGIISRQQTAGMFGGLIVEGPDTWPIRPVAEVNYEQDSSFEKTYSALVGVIWKAGEHLAFDLALRHAEINARPDEQVRGGLTFDL
jgi:hypothetical protein